jgi:hypothetical protein
MSHELESVQKKTGKGKVKKPQYRLNKRVGEPQQSVWMVWLKE